jgi:hypothetical protein
MLLLLIFGFPPKKIRKYKKRYQKIFGRNPKNNRSEKRILDLEIFKVKPTIFLPII